MRLIVACAGLMGITLLVFAGLGALFIDSYQADAIAWLHASAFLGLAIFVIAAIALRALIHAGK